MSEETRQSAVYIPWSTFKNALDMLGEGVPKVVDRTVFSTLSGSVKGQVLSALKFFDFIDDDGKPTDKLTSFSEADEAGRKKIIVAALKSSYRPLFDLDLEKATPKMLGDAIGDYNVSGETKEKAIRFFLSAVEYAQIPVSRFLKEKSASSSAASTPRKKAAPRSKTTPGDGYMAGRNGVPEGRTGNGGGDGQSRTIILKNNGGSITVSMTLNPLFVTKDDWDWVKTLVDRLNTYGAGSVATTAPEQKEGSEQEEEEEVH